MDVSPFRLLLALALAGPLCAQADSLSSVTDPNWKPDTTKASPLGNKSFFGQQSNLAQRGANIKTNTSKLKSFHADQSPIGGTAAIGNRTAKLPGSATLPGGSSAYAKKTFAAAGRSAQGLDQESFPVRTHPTSGKAATGFTGEYPTGPYEGKLPKDLGSVLAAQQKPNLTVEEVKQLLNVKKNPKTASAEVKPEAGLPLGERQGVEAETTRRGGNTLPAPTQRKARTGPGGGR